MLKSIDFYKVKHEINPMHQLVGDSISDILIKSPLTESTHNILNSEGVPYVTFNIYSKDEGYIFGTIGALKDPNDLILQCLRAKNDLSQILNQDELEYYLEHFTYFSHHLSNGYCSLLHNQEAPSFMKHYSTYLNDILVDHGNSGSSSFSVNRIIDEEIDQKINRMKTVSEVKLKFSRGSAKQRAIESLVDLYDSSNDIDTEVSIQLRAKGSRIRDEKKPSLLKFDEINSDYEAFKIIGCDQDQKEYAIDLIKRILSKKINLDIDTKNLSSDADRAEIRKILISALSEESF